MLELITLICAIALVFWLPIETRKVIGGWRNKRFKGDHAAYLTAYRKQLSLMRGLGIVLALAMAAIAVLEFTEESDQLRGSVKAAAAVIWAAVALVAHNCRNRFDEAKAAGRIPAEPAATA